MIRFDRKIGEKNVLLLNKKDEKEEEILNHISNIERLSDFKQSSFVLFFGVDAKNTLYIKSTRRKKKPLLWFLLFFSSLSVLIIASSSRKIKEKKKKEKSIFFCVCWSFDQRREFIVPFLCEKNYKKSRKEKQKKKKK